MKAACHCGDVRFETAAPPVWVLDCNCTICRRHGALWAYLHGRAPIELTLQPDPSFTEVYKWGDEGIAFHRCRNCGCVTHIEAVAADPPRIFGVNARMMVGLDPAKVQLLQIDNGHSGHFWTHTDEPRLVSRHPPMPPPGPNDWR